MVNGNHVHAINQWSQKSKPSFKHVFQSIGNAIWANFGNLLFTVWLCAVQPYITI